MSVWSKTLPLPASYLSPLSGLESHLGHLRKLLSDFGLSRGFCWVLQSPPPVTTA